MSRRMMPRSALSRGPARAGVASVAFFLALLGATVAARGASDRLLPPAVPPPQPIALPTTEMRTLPNGLRVLVVERHTLPVLTLRLLVRAGAETDPTGLPGTAQFAAGLLNEGTDHRSAIQIAEAIDGSGGNVDSSAQWDSSYLVLIVLADHAPLAFDLMADMAIHPAFSPAEVERARRQTLSALGVLHDDPAYVADAVLREVLLAGTPYGHSQDGTVAAVKRLDSAELSAYHAREYVPSRSVLAVVGDITAQAAYEQAARWFGGWEAGAIAPASQAGVQAQGAAAPEGPLAPGSALQPAAPPRIVVIDKPDAVQTEIRVGNSGIRRSSADYVALSVANQILGGPASNRLFSDLRGEHGLTYGASSDLDCYLAAGEWVAKTSTRTAETGKALHRVLDEMRRMRDRPIRAQELQQAVNYLIGHQALDFETSSDIADEFLGLIAEHLPLDTWSEFPAALRRLTPADVWQATRRHLDPDEATIVLVGNAKAFEKDLRGLGPARVIPIAQLDLGSPTLVR